MNDTFVYGKFLHPSILDINTPCYFDGQASDEEIS